jgi:hypothetical protein
MNKANIVLRDGDNNILGWYVSLRQALAEMERLTSSGEHDIIMVESNEKQNAVS